MEAAQLVRVGPLSWFQLELVFVSFFFSLNTIFSVYNTTSQLVSVGACFCVVFFSLNSIFSVYNTTSQMVAVSACFCVVFLLVGKS